MGSYFYEFAFIPNLEYLIIVGLRLFSYPAFTKATLLFDMIKDKVFMLIKP